MSIEKEILKEAEILVDNINYIYDNLEPRDYLDDEDEYLGCDSDIAIEYHNFYDEVVEAVPGFKKFYSELVKRFNGDQDACTWFLRVENAVCWMKYSMDCLCYFDFESNVKAMYDAYWRIVEKFHIYEDNN